MKKILDIVDAPITLHTNFAMPLSVILTKKDFYYWYLERFIQIIANNGNSEYGLDLAYFDKGPAHDEVLDKKSFDLQEFISINNIKEYIINKIESGFYIKLPLDNFYLSCKAEYKNRHINKTHLIYGYDSDNEIVYGLAYDKNYSFSKIVISFDEFTSGYISKVPDCNIILYKPLDFDYKFNLNIFKQNLSNYFNSIETSNNIMLISKKTRSYGIKAYRDFTEYLNLLSTNDKLTITYHNFHLFWEQKKLLLERLDYLKSEYAHELDLTNIREEYTDIVKLSESIRMLYIRTASAESESLYEPIKNRAVFKKMADKIDGIVDKEELIIERLLNTI